MKAPLKKPIVKLTGQDGNAFFIMGKIQQALRRGGADHEYIDQYMSEVKSGDYIHLLAVSMDYVDVR
jgi:hypothetical protein